MISSISGRQALVYEDEGVSFSSAEALVQQLQNILGPSITVKKVNSAYLANEPWEDKTDVVAMGGGKCSLWEVQLGDKGMLKIHQYVLRGGKYIGFCAGAYFGFCFSRRRIYIGFSGSIHVLQMK